MGCNFTVELPSLGIPGPPSLSDPTLPTVALGFSVPGFPLGIPPVPALSLLKTPRLSLPSLTVQAPSVSIPGFPTPTIPSPSLAAPRLPSASLPLLPSVPIPPCPFE